MRRVSLIVLSGLFILLTFVVSAASADCAPDPSLGAPVTCTGVDDIDGFGDGTNDNENITINVGAVVDDQAVGGHSFDLRDGNTVTNNGTITNALDQGIQADGNNTITNNGTINTNDNAINLSGDGNVVVNNGSMNSDAQHTVNLLGNNNQFTNNGDINYDSFNGAAVIINGDSNTFTNRGLINNTGAGSPVTIDIVGGNNNTILVQVGTVLEGPMFAPFTVGNQITFEYTADPAALAAFAALIAGKNPAGDNVTIGGVTYEWVGFNSLDTVLLVLAGLGGGGGGGGGGAGGGVSAPSIACDDGTAKIFRQPNGDLDVFSGFDQLPPNGFFVGRIDMASFAAGTNRFQDTGEGAKALEFGWHVLVTRGTPNTLGVYDANGNLVGRPCNFSF